MRRLFHGLGQEQWVNDIVGSNFISYPDKRNSRSWLMRAHRPWLVNLERHIAAAWAHMDSDTGYSDLDMPKVPGSAVTGSWTLQLSLCRVDPRLSTGRWGTQANHNARKKETERGWFRTQAGSPYHHTVLSKPGLQFSLTEATGWSSRKSPDITWWWTRWRKLQEQRLESWENGECRHEMIRGCLFMFTWNTIIN